MSDANGGRPGTRHVSQATRIPDSAENAASMAYRERQVSFRIGCGLLERIDSAALVAKTTRSEFIRRTIVQSADAVLRRTHE